jgi:hypothetical protein
LAAISAELRRLVRARAADRCEYCRIEQAHESFLSFHIEHVIEKQHGGGTSESNLALSCHHCNLQTGPNLSGIDNATRQLVPLFHPRLDRWTDHFELNDGYVVGLTPTGRATAAVLAMNAPARVQIRQLSRTAK